jgi:hypothetical protein
LSQTLIFNIWINSIISSWIRIFILKYSTHFCAGRDVTKILNAWWLHQIGILAMSLGVLCRRFRKHLAMHGKFFNVSVWIFKPLKRRNTHFLFLAKLAISYYVIDSMNSLRTSSRQSFHQILLNTRMLSLSLSTVIALPVHIGCDISLVLTWICKMFDGAFPRTSQRVFEDSISI